MLTTELCSKYIFILYITIFVGIFQGLECSPVTGLPAASEAKALNKRAVYCCITSSESSNISSTNFCKNDTIQNSY